MTARIAQLAQRQWGVVSRPQLERCGLRDSRISRWAANGRLHRVHPGVFALGHPALSAHGRLVAALLYAGTGAMLSHLTAAWWWKLLDDPPLRIHVSAAGRRGSIDEVSVHHPRSLQGDRHKGLPVTTVERTLLDVAAAVRFDRLRRALAEADYLRVLDVGALERILGRGRPGSAALRKALERHRPELARTLSVLEERFFALCEAFCLPLPKVNAMVGSYMVDALWPAQKVVVELDGYVAHGTGASMERDRQREMALRATGHHVLRYTWQQVTEQPEAVVGDLRAALLLRTVASDAR